MQGGMCYANFYGHPCFSSWLKYISFLFSVASHVSQFPSLNFLVYIPKRTESPLFIRPSSSSSDEHSQTDNFLVPQWGGMIIYNPGKLSQSIVESNLSGEDNGSVLVNVKMEKLMPIFIKQFKILLGISNIV